MTALLDLPATRLARMLAKHEISPVELTVAALESIAELDPQFFAFATVVEERALADARRAEQELSNGLNRGPLHGVPVAIKDNINVAGVTRQAGAKRAIDGPSSQDATVVRALREAGAVIVGTTRLDEFAFATLGAQTINPAEPSRWTGGSSGGSAAAIAAGFCAGAIGTDTGGSIRIPSACCRVVGLKPTYGLVSTDGVLALAWSLDHVGPMGRTAEDVGVLMGALVADAAPDAYVPAEDELLLRIGVPAEPYLDTVQPKIRQGFEVCLKAFERLGAEIIPVDLPAPDSVVALHTVVILAEAATYHRHLGYTSYGAHVRGAIEYGTAIAACDYLDAQRARGSVTEQVQRALGQVDVLALPTLPMEPGKLEMLEVELPQKGRIGAIPATVRLTCTFNHTGHPAVTVPYDDERALAGLQLVGPYCGEKLILQAAHAFERASGKAT